MPLEAAPELLAPEEPFAPDEANPPDEPFLPDDPVAPVVPDDGGPESPAPDDAPLFTIPPAPGVAPDEAPMAGADGLVALPSGDATDLSVVVGTCITEGEAASTAAPPPPSAESRFAPPSETNSTAGNPHPHVSAKSRGSAMRCMQPVTSAPAIASAVPRRSLSPKVSSPS